ncbi:MAG: GAF domain-containing protein, partial [Spirochaetales bacterium]|nr:GAF domain-containing protein [Spirochaetales bacterium]
RMIFIVSLLVLMFALFFALYFLGFANLFMSGSNFFVKHKWLDFGKPIIAVFYLIILSIFFIVVVSIMFRLVLSIKNDAVVQYNTVNAAHLDENHTTTEPVSAHTILSEKPELIHEVPPAIETTLAEPIPATIDESEVQSRIDNVYQNISQMAGEILQCIDISELFEKILFWGAGLSHSKRASIMVVDKNKTLSIYKTMGWSIEEKQKIKDIKLRIGEGIAGKVASDNKRIFVTNIDNYEGYAFPNKLRYKTKSFISLPIYGMHRVVAVLNLTDNKNGYYTVSDLEGLTIMAGIASKLFELIQYKKKYESEKH